MVTLTTQALSVSLGTRTVMDGMSLSLEPGRLIGIIGPNGAGKSTLIRALLGLVPYRGNIALDGAEITSLTRARIARELAYLPQGQILHWPLSVERLVGLGRLPHLAPMSRISAADQTIIDRAMKRADIEHLRDRVATELSGGERARVLLARALAVEARGLIADEPLASLDPGHQIDVMELLRSEAASGALVVAVLHDLTMAARYCDRLLLMDRGRLVAQGAPLEVLNEANLRSVYGVQARIEGNETAPLVVPTGRIAQQASN
ncbi:ABC transporter ATP-binding protein [Sphingomonas koreensis]|jgi:iron complex transport system ATP-binding protein|uniref:ABC transporter n=1 Tax=Sphingomonas koreensis TaxID=93064 RepID=A0A1L6JAP3_9SPHN|nr:ABC transporter ATP-binding protein [Sphingomonas koreensis]APR53004.1 ABC transporter [Sphingomonas koreensis]MDC7811366.1 ABC transporter ATP-binding protein [Sphingomonas koreensis]PJI87389.1 iron complex transport system ATP-binding protein [Sphingomonas koreensis]RSU18197.1 ABC transporter ATP-binding protein [Sphingomonas koreensis]RSU23507.1 ABC transporter ATP-binding protein [Sphingomonas koreensis]